MTSTSSDRRVSVNSGVAYKAPVKAATTANITLSGLQTIDGISCVADDRVLVKNQTDATQNGIYDVSATAWARSRDFDGPHDVRHGSVVRVMQGTAYAYTTWILTSANPITIDTSNITFRGANRETLIVALGDETTEITAGTAKVTFRIPYSFELEEVRASLTTTSSSGDPTFDINVNNTTILSTKLSIDAGETTSTTAVTPAVISSTSLADDDEIKIDIDSAGTGATGAKIYFVGFHP